MHSRALVIALLIVPFFLTGCGFKKADTKTPAKTATPSPGLSGLVSSSDVLSETASVGGDYFSIDPQSVNDAISQTNQAADGKAKLWRADAVLYQVSVKLLAPYESGKATEVYTYGSPGEAYDWWTITVSGKTGKSVRAVIPKEDYLGTNLVPIPVRFWKMNYIEALQLADSNGGSTYRKNHPGADVTVTLAVSEPKNYLWWTIEYQSVGADSLKILVNPSTKEVVTSDGIPLTATASSPSSTTSPSISPTSQTEEIFE